MCKGRFVTLGSGEMLTLAASMPVFHQVEEVIEMKQEVLVEISYVCQGKPEHHAEKLQVC